MKDEALDLRIYLNIILKWWWIFLVVIAIGGVTGYLINRNPLPEYKASTKVLVEGRQTPGTPSASDIRSDAELAGYYSTLMNTRRVLGKVAENLPAGYTVARLSGILQVKGRGIFIEISATDGDPVMAALVANVSAQTFIDDLQDRKMAQLARFQASLSQYGISQDPGIIAAQVATMRTLSILEEATPPDGRSNPPQKSRDVLLGAVAGLLIAGFAVFALEYFDDSIRDPEELKSLRWLAPAGTTSQGLMPIGSVGYQQLDTGRYPLILYDEDQRSPLAEAYKYVVLNLEFSALEEGRLRTLLITSALPGEGKTTTSMNLAVSMARGGKSVVLVDSDLRKPALHRLFDVDSQLGLTNVLLGTSTLDEVLMPTNVDGLKLITSGPIPPDSTRVLKSARMAEIIRDIEERAEVVIFDSPPVLAVADPIVLAAQVGGVLIVIDAKNTGRDPIRRAAQSIDQSNSSILGAILNKARKPSRRGGYYYYYHDSYSYSYGEGTAGPARNGRLGRLKGIFSRNNDVKERSSKSARDRSNSLAE